MNNENKLLTDSQAEAALMITEARKDLLTFSQLVDPTYLVNRHHEVIARRLERVPQQLANNEKVRIMITVPPRHGKSRQATQLFPAWLLGLMPTIPVITTSYSADLAEKFGQLTKDIIVSPQYKHIFPNIKLRKDSKSKGDWKITKGGSYTAVGVGGPITGKGAKCLPADTMIPTNGGSVRIEDLYHLQDRPMVLSFNHDTNQTEWKRIRAVARSTKKRFTTITTADGGFIRASANHPVYVVGCGYKKAKDIKVGESIIFVPEHAKKESDFIVSTMWDRFRERLGRILEAITPKKCGVLLRSSMLAQTPFVQVPPQMQDVRATNTAQVNGVLRTTLPAINTEVVGHTMPTMRNCVQADITPDEVLFTGVQKPKSFGQLARHIKSKLQGWIGFKVSDSVLQDTKQDSGKGQNVCGMSGHGVLMCTPQGRGQTKQPAREFSGRVFKLPCDTPQVYTSEVSSVVTVTQKHAEFTYDIQVEDNENFFADGVLVHNCAIIDDVLKNREEAESKSHRQKIREWYTSTLYTRLEGYGAVIVIMTRWHDDDLAGWLLEEDKLKKEQGEEGENWELFNFPAIADTDEYIDGKLFRKEGEALWPSKYSIQNLLSIKNTVGVYDWSSLYQQNPILAETQEFKESMFRYFTDDDIKVKNLKYYTVVDPAISQKNTSDNTVVLTIAKDLQGPNWYRIREDAGHYTPTQTVDLIFKHQKEYQSEVHLETVAYQKALKYSIEERQREDQVYFTVGEIKSTRNKEVRIRGLLPLYERGVIYHRRTDTAYETEALTFPKGRRDDRLDCMAMGIEVVDNTNYRSANRTKKPHWVGYGRRVS